MLYLLFFGPFIPAAISVVFLLAAPTARSFWATVGLTLFALCLSAVPIWSLRDGLSPDSTGLVAVERFLESMVEPALLAAIILVPAVLRYRACRHKA